MQKSFMRIDTDSYAGLRIENMPKASMSRSVGMNREIGSRSVPVWALIFSGLFAVGTRAEEGPDDRNTQLLEER